jgi:hypothetical protein
MRTLTRCDSRPDSADQSLRDVERPTNKASGGWFRNSGIYELDADKRTIFEILRARKPVDRISISNKKTIINVCEKRSYKKAQFFT